MKERGKLVCIIHARAECNYEIGIEGKLSKVKNAFYQVEHPCLLSYNRENCPEDCSLQDLMLALLSDTPYQKFPTTSVVTLDL